MEDFKVSVETLHTTKVKEINYEGEETYQDKPSLSKRLSELAQRMDFNQDEDESNLEEDSASNPSAKKSSRRWQWEYTHSKLKQALTEVSVLSDVLHIAQNHRQYLSPEPVYVARGPAVPVRVQYILKRQALGVARDILQKGADQLRQSSTGGDREFHKAIHDLRKRWRLRRTSVGVLGDLSYHSAGSLYTQSVQFEVHKGIEGSRGNSGPQDILSVVVPPELRGKSEVVIFVCDQPVREVVSLDAILPECIKQLNQKHSELVPWEQKLVSAQNVLFNEELFAQLAKEAFDQKSDLQGEVLTDRINIPLSTSTWLSVLLVREYEGTEKKKDSVPVQLPEPNWELSIAFKQLLRTNHQFVATARPPRPSNASSNEGPQFRSAGSSAMSATDMKQFEPDFSLYKKLLKMARHTDNEKKLTQWLNDLCGNSCEPHLLVTSVPSLSLNISHYYVAITSQGTSLRWILELTLSENCVSIKSSHDDVSVTLPVDKDKVQRSIKRQCILFMKEVVENLIEKQNWQILFESTLPHPSLSVLKTGGISSQLCGLTVEEPGGRKRLELLIGYGQITVNVCNISHLVELPTDLGSPLESKPVPEDTILTLTSDLGIIQQLTQLFNTI